MLSGSALPERGRLRVKVWNISPYDSPDLLWLKGPARIHRLGAFKLKLREQFPDGPVSLIRFVVRYTTKTTDLRRERYPEPLPVVPVCCEFGPGGACHGGLDGAACKNLSGYYWTGACDASGDCVDSPKPGSCCDSVPSQPGVCGAPADASGCVSAGGTFHPASQAWDP